MAEAKWLEQLGDMLLGVAAIVILWQVTYEQHLPVLDEMLEKTWTLKGGQRRRITTLTFGPKCADAEVLHSVDAGEPTRCEL